MNRNLPAAARFLFATLWIVLAAAPLIRAQGHGLDGERVVAIRVVTETGDVLQENPPELPQRPDQPFSSEAVRESLRRLYRTGRFADIRAEAASASGGLRLDFIVRQNLFINVVRVEGLHAPPSEAWALAAMRLGLGEIFRESTLKEAIERLRQALREEGLYRAQLEYQLAPHPDSRQMDITVLLTAGLRARIGTIELHNQTEFDPTTLLARTKLKPNRELTSARLDRAAERIRKFLAAKGHLGARVALRRGEYSPQSNTVPVVLEALAGPQVRVELSGAKIPARDLRKLLPIYEEAAVDEDLLQEGRRNIRDYLERDGYFDSQVRYRTAQEPQTREQVITYQVERRARHRLGGVAFVGNHYFSDELLSSRLQIQPAGFLSRGRFSRRLMQDDERSILELYIANGFRQVEVRGELIEDYAGKEGDLFVRFHIQEGPQTRVAELKLEGNRELSDDFLLSVIGSTRGQPYSEFNVTSDRDNLLALYYNEGFPEARFEAQISPGSQPARVRLSYRLVEGSQLIVERVLISGAEYTRPGVIARKVQLKPGDPLRQGELVETQRRLYNLGIFSRVAIAPQNPTGTETAKTLVVQVEEAKRYTLAYGFGVEVQRLGGAGSDPVAGEVRASPRGLFEFTRANFAGRAHTLSFKARGSTLQGRGLVSYTAPDFFAHPAFSLLLTGFADKTRDVRTFTATRYEASAQLAHRVSPFTSLLYRYSFRRVLVDPTSLRIPLVRVPLFSQPTSISALGMTWIRERRNNPTDATRGDFYNADLSVASRAFNSSASFVRLFIQHSSFHPIGRRLIFARSARLGIQEPLGKTADTQIPLPERFFSGGGNSLRGFGLNQAGQRDPDTGFPIGGLAMLLFNQELRFPMRLPLVGGRLGGALFYDAGNVFTRVNRITLRTAPRSPLDLNYFSHAIGFGFRYATPIGPVRLDVGYQLNPAEFEFCVPKAVTGRAPCVLDGVAGQRRLEKLPRVQFFINVGSIF
jgi:outer membrane protein assembly complex protein YaeT